MRAALTGQFTHLLSPRYFLPGLQLWLKSSTGVTTVAGKVTLWQDLSGVGNDAAFIGDPVRPDVDNPTLTGAGGPNGEPSVLFDGINDSLSNNTLTYTLPFYYWAVVRQKTWVDGGTFWISMSEPSLVGRIGQDGVTPNIAQSNRVDGAPRNSNSAMTLDTYFIVQALYSDATTDFLRVGTTTSTGQDAGNDVTDHDGYRLGANQDPGAYANIELVELCLANCRPNPLQMEQMHQYGLAFYPTLVS